MSVTERPTIVTIMAVIAIVWGAMGIAMQIIMFITDAVTGIEILLMGILSLVISVLSLAAGFSLGINLRKGFKFLKLYIYGALGFEAVYLVFSLLKGISFSWTRLAIAVIIPLAMLVLINNSETINSYRNSLQN